MAPDPNRSVPGPSLTASRQDRGGRCDRHAASDLRLRGRPHDGAVLVGDAGYRPEPPPPGFATWEDFAREKGIPEEMWDAWCAMVDPAGKGPRFFFQRVPEGSGGLEALGAERVDEHDEMGTHWVVMRDVEGNEFCVS